MTTKILIVEDEILVALQLEDVLTDAGHAVLGVVPDRCGLSRISEPPQVALVDVNLRDGRSGPSIAHELADTFGTRIVYVTANPDQIGIPASTAVGYVGKPFCGPAILEAVNFAMHGLTDVDRPTALHPVAYP